MLHIFENIIVSKRNRQPNERLAISKLKHNCRMNESSNIVKLFGTSVKWPSGKIKGAKNMPEYRIWQAMKDRCFRKKNPHYKNYGARGITVCERWINSFTNFIDDMGRRPDKMTLERKNNNGNYCPENCVWDTSLAQNNNSRHCRFVEFNGETKSVRQWAYSLGIPWNTLGARFRNGWSKERALTERVRPITK